MFAALQLFIDRCVRWSDAEFCENACRDFWLAVGVGLDMADNFAKWNPVWDPVLKILTLQSCMRGPNAIEEIVSLLIYPWRWLQFNAARFLTLGRGSQRMMQAELLGLREIGKLAMELPNASDYWLHHFSRIGPEHLRWVCLAGMSCIPTETVMAALAEDDRMALRAVELDDLVGTSMMYLQHLPMSTWARLAIIITPDESPPRLRSDVLAHALQATGFWREVSLERFMKPPWSNVRGDLVENAKNIQDAAPDTLDSETLKLHRLMQMGEITVHQVASFLRCLGQSPCSTLASEQGHSPLAKNAHAHPEWTIETILPRAYLQQCKGAVVTSLLDKQTQRIQWRLDALSRKMPQMMRSSSLFAGERLKRRRQMLGRGQGDLQVYQQEMRTAMLDFRFLDRVAKDKLSSEALDRIQSAQRGNQEEEASLMQDLKLYTERMLEERSSRPRHLLTSNHFTNEDYDRLHILYHTRVVSRSEVAKAIEIACTSQKPLRNDILRAFMTMPYHRSKEARVGEAPLWLKKLCKYRERFRDVVLVVSDDDGNTFEHAFYFLLANQSPYTAWFLECSSAMFFWIASVIGFQTVESLILMANLSTHFL